MTNAPAIMIVATLLFGCAHVQTSRSTQPELVQISLEDVSLLDAIRMSHRGPVSNFGFTRDTLSRQDLEKIRVTVKMEGVTLSEYWEELTRQTGLIIEEISYNYFRVTHRK